ncbi:MAG: hypothetical protein HYY46_10405 [Deltaproteobacteria bacterium]|nr:hypothetical protein [Deltaproteobacteria bacterium]
MAPVKVFSLLAAGLLLLGLLLANAQAQSEIRDVILKLGGQSCEANIVAAESALLRLRGVTMVDIERGKGYVVVGYDPTTVSIPQMLRAVGSQRGKGWFCTARVEAG